jgi:hypothetical protein
MGTNFYLGDEHVGKRSSLGQGNGCKFIWAMDPVRFFHQFGHVEGDNGEGAVEWYEVYNVVIECREFDYSLIGCDFS